MSKPETEGLGGSVKLRESPREAAFTKGKQGQEGRSSQQKKGEKRAPAISEACIGTGGL